MLPLPFIRRGFQLSRVRYQFNVLYDSLNGLFSSANEITMFIYGHRLSNTSSKHAHPLHLFRHSPVPHLRRTRVPASLISPLFIVLFLSPAHRLPSYSAKSSRSEIAFSIHFQPPPARIQNKLLCRK